MRNHWIALRLLMLVTVLTLSLPGTASADDGIQLRPSRCRGTISLTFDDGPDSKLTPVVLDVLAKYEVEVTFFVVGSEISDDEAIIQRMVAEGHSVQNHTWNHPYLTQLSEEEVISQIDQTSEAIIEAGAPAPKYVRPPYGDYSPSVIDVIESRGMIAVTWTNTLDIRDWDNISPEEIITRVVDNLQPGGVVLLHDVQPSTVEALPDLIDVIHQQGYCINPYLGEEFWLIDA